MANKEVIIMSAVPAADKGAVKKHVEETAMEYIALGRNNWRELELPYEERQKYETLYRMALLYLRSQGRSLATTFLGINRVVWTDSEAVPTACITASDFRPLIYVNVTFLDGLIDKFTEKKSKATNNIILAGVLAHELLHFVFRHGSKVQMERLKDKYLANMTFDIFINHFLKKMALHHFAEVLYPEKPDADLMFFLSPTVDVSGSMHSDMYQKINNVEASLEEIETYLLKHFPKDEKSKQVMIGKLVGSHQDKSENGGSEGEPGEAAGDGSMEGRLDSDAVEELDDVVREFFTKNGKGDAKNFNKGNSKFGAYFEDHQKVKRKKDQDFEDFSRKAFIQSVRGQLMKSVGRYNGPTHTTTYRPQSGNRRQIICAAAGTELANIRWKKPVKINFGKLRMYIDMSGSMTGLKDIIASIIAGLEKSWQVELFLFTTQIAPLTKQQFLEGKFVTGGTDFNCVFDHIREANKNGEGIKKVVMLTDGYDSGLSTDNIDLLEARNFDLYTVYTKDHSVECLKKYTTDEWLLNF